MTSRQRVVPIQPPEEPRQLELISRRELEELELEDLALQDLAKLTKFEELEEPRLLEPARPRPTTQPQPEEEPR